MLHSESAAAGTCVGGFSDVAIVIFSGRMVVAAVWGHTTISFGHTNHEEKLCPKAATTHAVEKKVDGRVDDVAQLGNGESFFDDILVKLLSKKD